MVIDRERARTLLTAVAVQSGVAPRLTAMFALMYYGALRPSEALDFRVENIAALPKSGWGNCRSATPRRVPAAHGPTAASRASGED
ncbi:MAG TPA: hypothetical protein VF755_05490 [Catenuloplanes sp.]